MFFRVNPMDMKDVKVASNPRTMPKENNPGPRKSLRPVKADSVVEAPVIPKIKITKRT